jgi:hypothetical protein
MFQAPSQPSSEPPPEAPTEAEVSSGMALAIRLGTVREPGTRAAAAPWPW